MNSSTRISKTPAAAAASSTLSSSLSSRRSPKLTLDLSCIPTMSQHAPVTNTLLITGLDNLDAFSPANLAALRTRIEQTARINTWSPLRSFRRIMVSFETADDARAVRQRWDGEPILGQPARVFYGMHTPLANAAGETATSRLALPDAGKLFFISPPPSPPVGWEMRMEDAPNKQVHADDLAEALAKLNQSMPGPSDALLDSPVTPVDATMQNNALNEGRAQGPGHGRSRSATLIWLPEQHGHSPDKMIPAIAVEDMCDTDHMSLGQPKIAVTHTMRPPVELMED